MTAILFWVIASLITINCLYYLFFLRLTFYRNKRIDDNKASISMMVCAKNEAGSLQTLIPKLLSQQHPSFQLVLINDASNDQTLAVMQKFAAKDERITIVNVENNEAFWGNKKYALTLGIKKAIHEHLLFIDADCQPASNHWLKGMTAQLNDSKEIVLGYGAYEKRSSFLNKLIRFETLLTAVQYLNYALWGNPYMGVGRNLAYDKSLFFTNNGFVNHMKLKSGDDDLFINEVANKTNTTICVNQKAFTYSIPKTNYIQWIRQKRRHVSTAVLYHSRDKFLLGVFYSSQLGFWIGIPLLLLAAPSYFMWTMLLLAVRMICQWVSMGNAAKKLNETDLILILPLIEPILILNQLLIFSANLVSKPTYWK